MNIQALNEGYRLMQAQLNAIEGDFELEENNEKSSFIHGRK